MRNVLTSTVMLVALGLLSACSGSGSSTASTTASSATVTAPANAPTSSAAATTPPGDSDVVWLCRPGIADDPCTTEATITEIAADGATTVERPTSATDPEVDCFSVYPTVSTQKSAVANLDIDPEEIAVATAQASPFSQVCRVFAPMYRQRTIAGIFGDQPTEAEAAYAYDDVRAAWRDYLAHDNDGRGVILIGHSQGTFVLTRLIADEIEKQPATLKLLVSAMLLGGNVTVPDGADVGGSFAEVPVCTEDAQTGCVVAYSAFSDTPVADAMFGRAGDGEHVVCTNPAALGGGEAPLRPAFVTGDSLLGTVDLGAIRIDTPWVGFPDRYSGECRSNDTHTWLQVTTHDASSPDAAPELAEPLGPTWGLHLVDMNIAMGDLVTLAARQIDAYTG